MHRMCSSPVRPMYAPGLFVPVHFSYVIRITSPTTLKNLGRVCCCRMTLLCPVFLRLDARYWTAGIRVVRLTRR